MRELRFEGLSEDGTRLVLVGKDGQRWSVVIDERVEAAVRRDRARLGQVEIEQSGELRPREIQARIRAGATAEDVAAASGLPLERIRRFEGPVLTERAWIALQAGRVPMRRSSGDVTLEEMVCERLASQGVAGEDITWDAWRPEDGAWIVIATFPLGPNTHVATWQYDTATRTITAVDDNAEDLSAPTPPAKLRLVASRPQLTAVHSGAADNHQDAPSQRSADAPGDGGFHARPWPQQHEATGPEPESPQPDDTVQPTALTSRPADPVPEPDPQAIASEPTPKGLSQSGLPQTGRVSADVIQTDVLEVDGLEVGGLESGGPESDLDQPSHLGQPSNTEATPVESESGPRPTPRNLRRNGKRVNRHPSGSQLPAATPQQASAQLPGTRTEPRTPPAQPSEEATPPGPPDPSTKAKPGRTAVPSFDDILFGPAPKH